MGRRPHRRDQALDLASSNARYEDPCFHVLVDVQRGTNIERGLLSQPKRNYPTFTSFEQWPESQPSKLVPGLAKP